MTSFRSETKGMNKESKPKQMLITNMFGETKGIFTLRSGFRIGNLTKEDPLPEGGMGGGTDLPRKLTS